MVGVLPFNKMMALLAGARHKSKNSRFTGKHRPAGSKLARMAAERRIAKAH